MKELENRFSLISLVCALFITLVGVLSFIGWLLEIPSLIQITPLAYIQANTSISFIFSGAALILLSRSRFNAVRLLSLFILAVSGLTLFQYLFSLNLGIDEFFFKDFIFEGASYPNRMAPNTALCFFLLGIVCIISTYCLNKNWGNLLTASLGAVIFFIASIALSGFLVGLEEAFGWGQMTRMSPQTAIAFLIASLSLISLAWKSGVNLASGFPAWAPSFASLAVIAIFIGIWQSLIMGERQFIRAEIEVKHESMTSKLLFELKDRTQALQRMGKRFEVNYLKGEYQKDWERDALNYLNHYEGLESIVWLDSKYNERWKVKTKTSVYAEEINAKVPPPRIPIMDVARSTGDSQISKVFESIQGQKVFYILIPLSVMGNFVGFLQGEIFFESILQKGMGDEKSGIETVFSENDSIFFQTKTPRFPNQEYYTASSEIKYKNLKWFVQCNPTKAFLSGQRSNKPEMVMGFGMFLAWTLGTAIRSRQKAREHELELLVTNEKLEEEFEKGREQQTALDISRKKFKNLFTQVKEIIEEVSNETGETLFTTLVLKLSKSMGFKYCFVGELDPQDESRVNILRLCKDSQILNNFSYSLKGTPCEDVVSKELCAFSTDVGKLFPEDKILNDLGVEAYVGIPLRDSSNNPLGILVAMHDEPVMDIENAKLILPLFADIAQSEMERQIYEQELQWESKRVQLSRDIAVIANDHPDSESTLLSVLEKMCNLLGWSVGHLYLREDSTSSYFPTRLWYFDSPEKYKVLKEVTENTTFETGIGLPGRVASTGQPEWIKDVYEDGNFPRAKKSAELGIHSALACPIMIRKDVVGVMEFFTPQILEVDWEILDLLGQVGMQIGRVLERKKAEEELKKQADVLDKIHDAVISLDLSLNITGWNRGAEHIFNYREGEVLNQPVSILFDMPSDVLKESVFLPAQINDNNEIEIKAVKKDGKEIYIHLSLSALCDERCKPQAFVCYALDITEKRLAQMEREKYSQTLEERVRQRTKELNDSLSEINAAKTQTDGILKSIGEGLIVTDLSGTIVLMNRSAEKILGLPLAVALGNRADHVIQNQVLTAKMLGYKTEEISGEPFDFELWGENGSREPKYVQGVSTVIRNEEGGRMGRVTVLRDITFEHKVDKLKSQFLSTAAHELRTPLTTLQGFSEILLNKKNLPNDSVEKYLRYINEESLKLGNIINDFLDISRIESGREIPLHKKTYAVSDTIHRSMNLFEEANKQSHEFVCQCPPKTVKWKVDLEKMEQVFKNLYSNAIKYSPEGGKITTSVQNVNDQIEVVVEDQGIGMTEEQVANVFNKFYRGENVERNMPGSGLGMTIVKYILEAHGGEVAVESHLGKGTKVTLCVPNN